MLGGLRENMVEVAIQDLVERLAASGRFRVTMGDPINVFLAQEGYFDGQRIHRLDTSIDVIQGGDPTGTGTGGPGYSIPDELSGDESYGPGVLAMANAGPDTGGSQFFLITGDAGHNLDANPAYTIFGMVVEGLDVAKRIQELPIQDPSAGIEGQQPKQSVYIEKVTIRESG